MNAAPWEYPPNIWELRFEELIRQEQINCNHLQMQAKIALPPVEISTLILIQYEHADTLSDQN
jgi:hypothetical protein